MYIYIIHEIRPLTSEKGESIESRQTRVFTPHTSLHNYSAFCLHFSCFKRQYAQHRIPCKNYNSFNLH